MKASNDTVSLTTVRRCGTVAGKELKNSEIGGTRIRKSCGFLRPHVLRREGGSHTTPARGKLPAVRFRFLTSRHPQERRVRTSPCVLLINRETFLCRSPLFRLTLIPTLSAL